MNAGDVNKVRSILKRLINNSIINSVDFIYRECNKLGNSPQEPDFIASLTLKFTPDLFNILKMAFPKAKFSVAGVFCHQKPLADIGSKKDPEIGDILFAYINTDKYGSKKFNSLLLQAKISTSSITTISSTDEHQLKLYSEWPQFKYKRAGKLNGVTRDILPKAINDGAQYLLIGNYFIPKLSGIKIISPMSCAIPSKTLSINNSLTNEIIDFLKFKSGRTFEQNHITSKDDWSKMIWDILNATKAKASKRNNAGLQNFPRQAINKFDGCFKFMSETKSIFGELQEGLKKGGINDNAEDFFDEENSAPSVILIESNEQNEE